MGVMWKHFLGLPLKPDYWSNKKFNPKEVDLRNERTDALLEQVCDDLEVPKRERPSLAVVFGDSLEPMNAGVSGTSFGAFLLFPRFFAAAKEEEIDLRTVGHKTRWLPVVDMAVSLKLDELDAATQKKLKETMLLSDKALKYVMAENLAAVAGKSHMFAVFRPTGIFSLAYLLAGVTSTRFRVQGKLPRRVEVIGYIATTFISVGIYMATIVEGVGDEELEKYTRVAELGKEYAEGAVEYHEKAMARNKLIRKAIKYGDSYITEEGDLVQGKLEVEFTGHAKRLELWRKTLEDAEALKAEGVPHSWFVGGGNIY